MAKSLFMPGEVVELYSPVVSRPVRVYDFKPNLESPKEIWAVDSDGSGYCINVGSPEFQRGEVKLVKPGKLANFFNYFFNYSSYRNIPSQPKKKIKPTKWSKGLAVEFEEEAITLTHVPKLRDVVVARTLDEQLDKILPKLDNPGEGFGFRVPEEPGK